MNIIFLTQPSNLPDSVTIVYVQGTSLEVRSSPSTVGVPVALSGTESTTPGPSSSSHITHHSIGIFFEDNGPFLISLLGIQYQLEATSGVH